MAQLLPARVTTTPTWRYLVQTARTNNAAPVAVGGTKPTSVYGITPVDNALHVIAHLSEPVDKYLMQDADVLSGFLQNEMIYGLGLALENQIVNGDGTAPHMRGLLQTSGIQTVAFTSDKITTVRHGITMLETAGFNPTALVVSPADWEAIELFKDGDGRFYFLNEGTPIDRAARKLWGVQVVTSNYLATGTGLLMDTNTAQLVSDSGIAMEWNPWAGFSANELVARCEGRFGLDVRQPSGIAKLALA